MKGFIWPPPRHQFIALNTASWLTSAAILDAANEKCMMWGHIYIDGEPSAAKTLSSSGGKIHWMAGNGTWANASSVVRVGIQDIDNTAGPPPTADGSWDVYADLDQPSFTVDNNFQSTAMTSGSKSISHRDIVMVVIELTARGGVDTVIVNGTEASRGWPGMSAPPNTAAVNGSQPHIIFEFDDGTLGWYFGAWGGISVGGTSESWQDGTNPDERGNILRVPWNIKIDALFTCFAPNTAAADGRIAIYRDPYGTPVEIAGVDLLGEHRATNVDNNQVWPISPVSLSRDTDYAVALKATSTGTWASLPLTFNDANYRKCLGQTSEHWAYATRNGGSGAFTATTTKFFPLMGFRISDIDTGPSPSYHLGI